MCTCWKRASPRIGSSTTVSPSPGTPRRPVPPLDQLLERLGVAPRVRRLEDRALVPVQLQPALRVEDLLDVLRGRSLAIRILDPQHAGAPAPTCQAPVGEGSSSPADVERTGRRRSEAESHEVAILIGAHVSQAGGLPEG